MAHLLTVVLAIVRQHVDDDQPSARLEHARDFIERASRIRDMVEHQHDGRRIQPRVINGQRLEIAAPEIDVVESVQAPLGCLQHRGRRVDRDHVFHERRERGAHLAGAAAEVADSPVGLREGGQRGEMKTFAEHFLAHAIPVTGGRREELLRFGAALGERGLKAALILRGGRRRAGMLADERPEPARGRVEAVAHHRVKVARALGARRDPAAVGQRLEMPAHRGLGQLQHGAQLRHGQLVTVEDQQEAAARRVRERREVVVNGGRAIHPCNRMKGYNERQSMSTTQRGKAFDVSQMVMPAPFLGCDAQ